MNLREKRNANIELLRVVSMFMIGILHASGHGGVIEQYTFGTTGYVVWALIKILCMVAVNCFVLVTGYFMVNSKIVVTRIVKFILQILFYSVVCTFGVYFIFGKTISLEEFVNSLFPLTSNQYWFATSYVLLMLFIPILNKLVRVMGNRELKNTIIMLILVFSVIPSIFVWSYKILGLGTDFNWLCVVYLAGGYLRVYGTKISKKKALIFYILLSILGAMTKIVISMLTFKLLGKTYATELFYSYNKMIVFPASVFFFIYFCQIKVKNRFLINISKLGVFCFGAYLISDHEIIRKQLWEKVNLPALVEQGIFFTVGGVMWVSLIILLIGCLVEWMRLKFLELSGIDKKIEKFATKIENSKTVHMILR